ncbi:hypothetical protein [Comamonas sp.]|uniref:hypothetical protein n=1 Tax=Comamonas sp. TaxID=34028 RepID=UPI0028A2BA2A|nr:hypothetical protein [Comamonas sp.]
MPLVVPTPIPAYPPAPQPTDDRVSFSTKAFALAASYEPQRVAFNTAISQVFTNSEWAQAKSLDAQNAATAAGQSAAAADASRQAADIAVQDVRNAMDAIQVGPVASVMGRTGVVTGLVEAGIGATRNKSQLMANAPIGQWAAFYDHTGVGADWPPAHPNTNWWNVFTFGSEELGQVTQRASQTLATAYQGWVYERQRDTTWGPWQRVIGDRSVIEKRVIVDARSATTPIDQKNGSIQTVVLYQNTSIVMPVPRDIGDQLTIEVLPTGAFTASFAGVPVRLPVGGALPTVAAWQRLMLTFIPRYDIGVWDMFIAGVHES